MDFYRWVRTQWDRAAAIALVVAGLISLTIGYFGVSGATLPTEQLPYLASEGLFGIFALGAAATLWLSADLRDEWRKLDDIHRDMRANNNDDSADDSALATVASSARTRRTTVTADKD
jgi:hypothetical protein